MRKPVIGYEGLYEVDDMGTVFSITKGIGYRVGPLKPYMTGSKYLKVNLYKNKKATHMYVHRIVAETFIPNPQRLPQVNHINGVKTDNRLENLEWCTEAENAQNAISRGVWRHRRPVTAINEKTGERREYPFRRHAAVDLFGKWYAFDYLLTVKGLTTFKIEDWIIKVHDEIHSA